MKEDEAKTKWCPFTRVGEQASGAAENRPDGNFHCIGSACMAWRWSEPKRTAAFLEAVQKRMQASAKPSFNKAMTEVWTETGGQFERIEGWCGLAGASA